MSESEQRPDRQRVAAALHEQLEQLLRLMAEYPHELWYATAAKHVDRALENLERIDDA